MTKGSRVVGLVSFLATATGISDGISLKENDISFFEGDFWLGLLSGRGLEKRGSGGEGGSCEDMSTFHNGVTLE